MRDFDDIVPRTESDEILAHIYSVLVEIRDVLVPTPSPASGPDAVVTEEEASAAASVLATHEHQTADEPEVIPEPTPAPKKAPTKRRTQAKKPAPRRKPA